MWPDPWGRVPAWLDCEGSGPGSPLPRQFEFQSTASSRENVVAAKAARETEGLVSAAHAFRQRQQPLFHLAMIPQPSGHHLWLAR